jgi:two-component system sensor histidine kinase UhpB
MPRPLRALIVEDELDDRLLIEVELRRAGFTAECRFVATAAEFAAAIACEEWDVILSDYRLAGFTGQQALEILKSNGRDIPFIIVSGTIDQDLAAAMMRMGAGDYIDKQSLRRIGPAIEREVKECAKRRAARTDMDHAATSRDDAVSQLELQIARMPMGHVVFDAEFRITSWNRAAEEIFGFTEAEAIAMQPPFPEVVPDSTRATIMDRFRRAASGDMNAHSINENITKSGRRIVCQWWNTPLMDAEGRFTGLLSLTQDVTARESYEQQLRSQAQQLRALSAKMTSIRETEGLRIARELHDVLGSALTAIKWDLEHLAASITPRRGRDTAEQVKAKLSVLAADAEATILAVQRIATELRPSVLDDLGLLHALRWQTRDFEQRTGIACECVYGDEDLEFSGDEAMAFFRIVQEALSNVMRHSCATKVQVTASVESDQFVVRVRDNGVGITAEQQTAASAIGLLGMHERAALIGASVTIMRNDDVGTTVGVRLRRRLHAPE